MKSSIETGAAKSKFSLSSLKVTSTNSGARVSNDVDPIVETSSQLNKFRMNKLSSEVMGVVAGNRIKILTTQEETIDGKYIIVVTADDDITGAKLASPTKQKGFGVLQFNFAGVWAKMTQGIVDAVEKSGKTFVSEGVAIERNGGYFIDHKTIYTIVEVDLDGEVIVDPATGAEYTRAFALVSPKQEEVDLTKEFATRSEDEAAE